MITDRVPLHAEPHPRAPAPVALEPGTEVEILARQVDAGREAWLQVRLYEPYYNLYTKDLAWPFTAWVADDAVVVHGHTAVVAAAGERLESRRTVRPLQLGDRLAIMSWGFREGQSHLVRTSPWPHRGWVPAAATRPSLGFASPCALGECVPRIGAPITIPVKLLRAPDTPLSLAC